MIVSMKKNTYLSFIVLTPLFLFVIRNDYIKSYLFNYRFMSFIGEVILSLLLLGITLLFGFFYLYLNNKVNKSRYVISIQIFFSIIVPLLLIGYDVEYVINDTFLMFTYFIFIFTFSLYGRLVYTTAIEKIILIEKSKGLEFPQNPPSTGIELIPYHVAAILFLFLPVLSPH